MEIYFEKSFEKDLRAIDDKKLLKKVREIIARIHTKARQLQTMLFRSCNVCYSWKPEAKKNNTEMMRSAACRYFLVHYPRIVRIPIKTLCFIIWPFSSLHLAFRAYFFFGAVVQAECGKGFLPQISALIWLAWTECVAPRYYYQYRLFEDSRMMKRHQYLFHQNFHYFFTVLNGFASGEMISDKGRFAVFCAQQGIPAPVTLAIFRNGTGAVSKDLGTWKDRDIVVKPLTGNRGHGIRFCYAEGEGQYRYQGRSLNRKKLIRELREEARLEPILLQERLYNHPEIRQMTNEYLASIRIVTYLNASGNPCFLAALLLLPHDEIICSNQGRGFPLEPETGKILSRPILPLLPDRKDDTLRAEELIVGKTVPYWKEARALALASHRLLPEYFSLGWDVAIGGKGPIIIETNIGWDADNIQYFHDLPLGNTEFTACTMQRISLLGINGRRVVARRGSSQRQTADIIKETHTP